MGLEARGTIERLRKMGAKVAITPWLENGKYWIGFVEDPDGFWVEIQSPVAAKGAEPPVSGPSGPS